MENEEIEDLQENLEQAKEEIEELEEIKHPTRNDLEELKSLKDQVARILEILEAANKQAETGDDDTIAIQTASLIDNPATSIVEALTPSSHIEINYI